MKYNSIVKLLERSYSKNVSSINGMTYFMNASGDVVATENHKHNLLVMYVYAGRDVVWNHHDVVAVAIAKNFKLVHHYNVRIADVVVMQGLCGTINTFQRSSNMLLEATMSKAIEFPEHAERSTNVLIVKYPNIYYGSFKSKVIGTMGHMKNATEAVLDIGISIDMSNLVRDFNNDIGFDSENMCYGILSRKKIARKGKKKAKKHDLQPKDYDVYKHLRSANAWYWNAGYNTCNSDKRRAAIEYTRNGNNYHWCAKVQVTCS